MGFQGTIETTTPERREKYIKILFPCFGTNSYILAIVDGPYTLTRVASGWSASAGGVHWRCCNRTAGHQGGVEMFTNVLKMHIAQNYWTCKMYTVYLYIYIYVPILILSNCVHFCCPWQHTLEFMKVLHQDSEFAAQNASRMTSEVTHDLTLDCRSSRPRPLCKTARAPYRFWKFSMPTIDVHQ